jgi:hypothetical protein
MKLRAIEVVVRFAGMPLRVWIGLHPPWNIILLLEVTWHAGAAQELRRHFTFALKRRSLWKDEIPRR